MFMLIIPSFAWRQRYTARDETTVATDGVKITQTEWTAPMIAESERACARCPHPDAKLLDSPQARYATLERLVDRVVASWYYQIQTSTSDQRWPQSCQQPEIACFAVQTASDMVAVANCWEVKI
jgi:peptidyl-prolyl cis-trans isomerase D